MDYDPRDQRGGGFLIRLYDDFHRRPALQGRRLHQAKFFLVLLAGDEHLAVGHFCFEQGLLVGTAGERQGDLPAFGGTPLHGEHNLGAQAGVLEIALVDFTAVVQPIGHLLDIGRHVEVVVHRAFAALVATALRHRAPAAVGEDLGEAFGALRPDAVLAPPLGDLGLVGCAGTALINAAHTIGELHEPADVIGRRVIVAQLGAARSLGHRPTRRCVVVEPAGVVNEMGKHVRHPAGSAASCAPFPRAAAPSSSRFINWWMRPACATAWCCSAAAAWWVWAPCPNCALSRVSPRSTAPDSRRSSLPSRSAAFQAGVPSGPPPFVGACFPSFPSHSTTVLPWPRILGLSLFLCVEWTPPPSKTLQEGSLAA